jgi:hypothetical protein
VEGRLGAGLVELLAQAMSVESTVRLFGAASGS